MVLLVYHPSARHVLIISVLKNATKTRFEAKRKQKALKRGEKKAYLKDLRFSQKNVGFFPKNASRKNLKNLSFGVKKKKSYISSRRHVV